MQENAQVFEARPFFKRFNPFCNHADTQFLAHAYRRTHDRLPTRITVNIADQIQIQLDHIRPYLDQVIQASVSFTKIIKRDGKALCAIDLDDVHQMFSINDLICLGYFKDQSPRIQIVEACGLKRCTNTGSSAINRVRHEIDTELGVRIF